MTSPGTTSLPPIHGHPNKQNTRPSLEETNPHTQHHNIQTSSSSSLKSIFKHKQPTNGPRRSLSLANHADLFVKQVSDKIELHCPKPAPVTVIPYPSPARDSQKGLAAPVYQRRSSEQVMEALQLLQQFVSLAQLGSQQAILEMKSLLEKDPKRFMYERSNRNHLINKPNSRGYNACYIASKNGHVRILEFLFKNNADMLLPTIVNKKYSEYAIEVAARWRHIETVKWFMEKVEFPEEVYDSVYMKVDHPELEELLKPKVGLCTRLTKCLRGQQS